MNKKLVLGGIVFVIVVGVAFLIMLNFDNKKIGENEPELSVKIIVYKDNSNQEEKVIKIESEEDLNKCRKFYKELRKLNANEMVDLAILLDIKVVFNDSVQVTIQKDESKYCYYINKDEEISEVTYTPNGMYDWVIKKIQEQ